MATKRKLFLAAGDIVGLDNFEGVSKAAVVDAYLQAVAALNGHCDDPATFSETAKDLAPVLRIRRDRLPAWVRRFDAEGE